MAKEKTTKEHTAMAIELGKEAMKKYGFIPKQPILLELAKELKFKYEPSYVQRKILPLLKPLGYK